MRCRGPVRRRSPARARAARSRSCGRGPRRRGWGRAAGAARDGATAPRRSRSRCAPPRWCGRRGAGAGAARSRRTLRPRANRPGSAARAGPRTRRWSGPAPSRRSTCRGCAGAPAAPARSPGNRRPPPAHRAAARPPGRPGRRLATRPPRAEILRAGSRARPDARPAGPPRRSGHRLHWPARPRRAGVPPRAGPTRCRPRWSRSGTAHRCGTRRCRPATGARDRRRSRLRASPRPPRSRACRG